MGLPPGRTNNPLGRPKGVENKVKWELRLQINEFLESNFPKIIQEFHTLKGRDKVKLYCDLLPYALPRLESIEMKELESLTEAQIDEILAKLRREYNDQEISKN